MNTLTIDAMLVTVIVSFVIPVLTGLVTKITASTWMKQAITALLSVVSGGIVAATQLDGSAVFSQEALLLMLGQFLLTQMTYLGLYKPHDVSARLAPDRGLG